MKKMPRIVLSIALIGLLAACSSYYEKEEDLFQHMEAKREVAYNANNASVSPYYLSDTQCELVVKPLDDSNEISVNIFYTDDAGLTFAYHEVSLSMGNITNESISLISKINNIEIDSMWCEDTKLYVNLNKREKEVLEAGSAAGMSITGCIVRTFMTYPNIESIEILLGGEKGVYGNHFNFDVVFTKADDRIIIISPNGMESGF